MRPYTLAFSVAVHLLVVALIVITPIVANGVPPEPRRAFDFIVVRPVDPPPSPPSPVQRDRRTMAAATNRGGAPLDAPDGITQETGLDDLATAMDDFAGAMQEGVPGDGSTGLLPGGPSRLRRRPQRSRLGASADRSGRRRRFVTSRPSTPSSHGRRARREPSSSKP